MKRAAIIMVALSMGLLLPPLWVVAFNTGGLVMLTWAIALPLHAVVLLGQANKEE